MLGDWERTIREIIASQSRARASAERGDPADYLDKQVASEGVMADVGAILSVFGAEGPLGVGAKAQLDYMARYAEAGALVLWMSSEAVRRRIVKDSHELTRKLKEVPFQEWKRAWRYSRMMISLQARLYLEQVFYDMGEPWSALVTGFKALGQK